MPEARVRIGDVPHDPSYRTAYRRKNGATFQRLGETTHIPVVWREMKGLWLTNGSPEIFDPDELVEFIPERTPTHQEEPVGFV